MPENVSARKCNRRSWFKNTLHAAHANVNWLYVEHRFKIQMTTRQPTTIELNWERFYTEYSDVYDKFAVSSIEAVKFIEKRFGLHNKVILDVGSGTGVSTYEMSKYAHEIIGIEPWKQMREYAESKRTNEHQNVKFLEYAAESEELDFENNYFDAIISIFAFPFWFVEDPENGYQHAKRFMVKAKQLLKDTGVIIVAGNSTGWEAVHSVCAFVVLVLKIKKATIIAM